MNGRGQMRPTPNTIAAGTERLQMRMGRLEMIIWLLARSAAGRLIVIEKSLVQDYDAQKARIEVEEDMETGAIIVRATEKENEGG